MDLFQLIKAFSSGWKVIILLSICALSPVLATDLQKFDYGWLLKLHGKEYYLPAHEKQLKAVFAHIIPQGKISLYNGPAANEKLNEMIFNEFSTAQPMHVVDNRYVVLDGSEAHFATEESICWIDTAEDKSVTVVSTEWWKGEMDTEGEPSWLIMTNSYRSVKQIPPKFWSEFAAWRTKRRLSIAQKKRFIGPSGKLEDIVGELPGG